MKLKEVGYRVAVSADAVEALERVRQLKPDLILLDLKMEGIDGTEFLSRLRQEDPKTKVIVVSAYPHEIANVHTHPEYKIEGYYEKPVDLENLLDRIERTIGGPA